MLIIWPHIFEIFFFLNYLEQIIDKNNDLRKPKIKRTNNAINNFKKIITLFCFKIKIIYFFF